MNQIILKFKTFYRHYMLTKHSTAYVETEKFNKTWPLKMHEQKVSFIQQIGPETCINMNSYIHPRGTIWE